MEVAAAWGSVMLGTLTMLVSLSQAHGVLFPSAESQACLRSDDPLLPCVLSGAVSWAEAARSQDINIGDGLFLLQDREDQDLPTTGDPRETRTLVEAMERAVGRRRLVWEMDWLYPGLAMLVSRGPDPRLYFAVDGRTAQAYNHETTGRLLVRRAVVPVLLGVNLKLISLVPLLVAGLVILLKKALLFSKLSLLVSGLGLYRLSQQQQQGGLQQEQHFGGLGSFAGNRGSSWDWQHEPFNITNSFF